MSQHTEKATRIVEGAGGRPQDWEVEIAQTHAMIAQAEALERIADRLELLSPDGEVRVNAVTY